MRERESSERLNSDDHVLLGTESLIELSINGLEQRGVALGYR
jgi:hypothetical protein